MDSFSFPQFCRVVLVRLSWAGFYPQGSDKRFQLTSCELSSSSKLLGTIRLTFCTLQSKVQNVSLTPFAIRRNLVRCDPDATFGPPKPRDFAVWQGLLELGDASVGDLSTAEIQRRQFRQSRQVFQASIGDPHVLEPQVLEFGHILDIF